jgi:hypothetical protein
VPSEGTHCCHPLQALGLLLLLLLLEPLLLLLLFEPLPLLSVQHWMKHLT